jgi:hypothetical protein
MILVVFLVVGALGGWYVHDRTGPRDAATAGARLRADTRTLASELGLRGVSADPIDATGDAGEECGVSQGGRLITRGPHRQHRMSLRGRPPSGRAAAALRPDAEAILDRLGYRIITDRIDFDAPPPDGIVIAQWGWSDVLEVTLWPEGETVTVTGRASCLPAG